MQPRTLTIHGVPQTIGESLSALVPIANRFWLGADEGTALASAIPGANSGEWNLDGIHDLGALLELPGTKRDKKGNLPEVDGEGLTWDGRHLWIAGSHSLKRKQPKTDKTEGENFERLAEVEADGNRYLLGRLPLSEDGQLLSAADASTPAHCAAKLPCDIAGSALLVALRDDPLFARFIQGKIEPDPKLSEAEQIKEKRKDAEKRNIPGKDNGIDIEGLAALGPDHLLVGLRGPVLRGWAIVLELRLACEEPPGDGKPGVLSLRKIGERPYRVLAFELGGLGIRDICIDEETGDLLILAGPTMVLPYPAVVFRWEAARKQLDRDKENHFIWNSSLHAEEEMAESKGKIWDSALSEAFRHEPADPADRAESLCLLGAGAERRIVIGYDNADRWVKNGSTLRVDAFPFPNKSA